MQSNKSDWEITLNRALTMIEKAAQTRNAARLERARRVARGMISSAARRKYAPVNVRRKRVARGMR